MPSRARATNKNDEPFAGQVVNCCNRSDYRQAKKLEAVASSCNTSLT